MNKPKLKKYLRARYLAPIGITAATQLGPLALQHMDTDTLSALPVPDSFLARFGRMRRPYGMAPSQFNHYVLACYAAGINPNRVVQTIGDAPASDGFHLKDGEIEVDGVAYDYSAATDISIRGLSRRQIHFLLSCLADNGFYGWYRYRGSWVNHQHVHFVYADCAMKRQLRNQFHDYCADKDGLAYHGHEPFFQATKNQKDGLRVMFFNHNTTT